MKILMIVKTIAAGACILVMGCAHAAILTGYDFDDGTNNATTAATFTDVDITASNFGVGAGLIPVLATQSGSGANDAQGNPFGTANNHNFGGTENVFGFDGSASLANALTDDNYLTFSVTPQNGTSFDLTSVTFRHYIGSNIVRSANSWALFSSVDGFAQANAINTGTSAVQGWQDQVVTLGSQFDNVSTTTEFRLYIFGESGGSTNSQSIFDKVVLNGEVVAIPEPSTFGLLGLGFAALFLKRRRRRLSTK